MFDSSNCEKISFFSPDVSPFKILRTHGYKQNNIVRPRILDAANIAVQRLKNNSTPEGFFCIKKIINKSSNKIELECGRNLICKVFDERLPESKMIIVFIITLGVKIDEKIKEISNEINEPLGAIFLENASWLALELILREARLKIIQFAQLNDMKIENRMAPGYSYPSKKFGKRIMWELEQQGNLFKLFDYDNLTVSLSNSFTMMPRMSRSGIFGLKENL